MALTKAELAERVLNAAWEAGVHAARIGTVGGARLVIQVDGDQRAAGCKIDLELTALYAHWGLAIPRALGQD